MRRKKQGKGVAALRNKNKNEEVFKKIARHYVLFEGERLDKETKFPAVAGMPEPKKPATRPRKGYGRILAAAAAVFVIVFGLVLYNRDFAPHTPKPTGPSHTLAPGPAMLSFQDNNFYLISAKEDNGEYIYTVGHKLEGPIVIALSAGKIENTEGLRKRNLGSRFAYTKEDWAYSLLMYEEKGHVVTLTSPRNTAYLEAFYNILTIHF